MPVVPALAMAGETCVALSQSVAAILPQLAASVGGGSGRVRTVWLRLIRLIAVLLRVGPTRGSSAVSPRNPHSVRLAIGIAFSVRGAMKAKAAP